VDFVTGILDGLELPRAPIVANSMGSYFALVFALAHPERVTKLVFLGEPAASGPPQPNAPPPPPAPKNPTIEGVSAVYKFRLGMNLDNVPAELLDEEVAAAKLPGAGLAWDTMREEFQREALSTYALRPELKAVRASTLFIWGDKDVLGGGPPMGREMAALMPSARCEVVHDAGHITWVDQLERCAKLTREFLKAA
jgi:pimeloyl-ACP methyl ester carboxylesterase